MGKDLPIYVINRAGDTDRLAEFSQSAPAETTRIAALDGHHPDAPLFLYRDMVGDFAQDFGFLAHGFVIGGGDFGANWAINDFADFFDQR